MVDREKFQSILIQYKQVFKERIWPDEKFKWAAVKHFQDHWDIHAEDFAKMFERATGKAFNLLASSHFYPRATILRFAQDYPEDTRAMSLHRGSQSTAFLLDSKSSGRGMWDLFQFQ